MSADEKADRLESMMDSLLHEMQKPRTLDLREAEMTALLELPGQVRDLTTIAKEARDTASQTKKILVGNGGATTFWDYATFGLIEDRSQHLVLASFPANLPRPYKALRISAVPTSLAPTLDLSLSP